MGGAESITRENYLAAEARVLALSGLAQDQFRISDVPIWEGATIRTFEIGHLNPANAAKPKLVFIHGYGGSGALFFNVMRPLAEHFHTIFFDIVGMGGSTRAPFNVETPQEGEEYFVRSIELWRAAMGLSE